MIFQYFSVLASIPTTNFRYFFYIFLTAFVSFLKIISGVYTQTLFSTIKSHPLFSNLQTKYDWPLGDLTIQGQISIRLA